MSIRSDHVTQLSESMESWCVGQDMLVANATGSIVVASTHTRAFEGHGQLLRRPVLGLCTGGGGRTWKKGIDYYLDDLWYPGKVGLAAPSPPMEGCTPAMAGIFISFDMDVVPQLHGMTLRRDDLIRISSQLYDDPLATSVMTALWREAEVHGASSMFFEHGLANILFRLATLSGVVGKSGLKALAHHSSSALDAVYGIVEERLDEDLRVLDMAIWAGVDSKTLTRMFKRETGETPYSYLTSRRMERAKKLLLENVPVTEIALAVGYANPAKFSATFRRRFGVTPTEWARVKVNC